MASVVIAGNTSGTVSLTVPAVAGSNTITLPASTGTVALTSGLPASGQLCKAWANFTGSTGAVNGSYNISSITRNGAGDYTFNFTTAMANTNYCYVGFGYGGGANYQLCGGSQGSGQTLSTGSLRAQYGYVSSVGGGLSNQDPLVGYITVFSA